MAITTLEIMKRAVLVKRDMALASTETKNLALECMAEAIIEDCDKILAANSVDIENARKSVSDVMIDRMLLDKNRVEMMSEGIRQVISLNDPVGRVISRNERENGLLIDKISVPMGVVAMIYESRPNVTSDAASLAVKSGNVCILRCGKEAWRTSNEIANSLRRGLKKAGLPEDCVQLIQDTSRESSYELMNGVGYVDLLIPRGGAGLIRACVENAKVPCIQTGTGICHIYVDKDADLSKALDIVNNAKTSRPSVCNAAEVCLVHEVVAEKFLPSLKKKLVYDRIKEENIPVEIRGDEKTLKIIEANAATENDFDTEFLDYIMAVKIVSSIEEAIDHIAAHSTGHSEAIVTENEQSARVFTSAVDSAAVYVNASTRFTDGGEFGFGCEIGISTQKLHARGPMGLNELTSYKYVIHGNGQIR